MIGNQGDTTEIQMSESADPTEQSHLGATDVPAPSTEAAADLPPTATFLLDDDLDDGLDDEMLGNIDLDAIINAQKEQKVIKSFGSPTSFSAPGTLGGSALKFFYMRMFPFKDYYKWISYGNVYKHYFPNREFSFTLANDVYIRFQSFKDEADLRNNIISKCPEKIDLGAVYNMKPSDRKLVKPGALQPLEHELVFDIDMTDYDDIRTCCSGADICHKCWSFMTIAIKIIDRALEDDFGFSHRLWVYSGRRGVHCWVCDARARKLTAEQRRSIVSYLEVVKGGDKAGKKVNLRNGHPSLSRAQKVLERHFEQTVLEDMGILDGPNTWTKILDMISNEQIRAELVSKWSNSNKTGYDRWADLVSAIKNPKLKAEPWLEREIMFQFLYPRLDSNVSVGLNHLLKSPFCVHPKTGRVCVPINAAECENFDPAKVPTVDDLIVELTEYQKQRKDEGSADDSRVPDYEKTSLKSYTDYFKTWVKDLGEENLVMLRLKREAEEKTMTF